MEFEPHPLAHRWRFSPARSLCSPRHVAAIAAFAEQGGTVELSREGDGIPDNLKFESAMATGFKISAQLLQRGK
jgi:hypothetical protein